jgi:hypothetical protein
MRPTEEFCSTLNIVRKKRENSAMKKKTLARWQASFFPRKKARHTKSFCLRMMKNRQHQHKGKPHTEENSQSAAVSSDDAIIIIRGSTNMVRTVFGRDAVKFTRPYSQRKSS